MSVISNQGWQMLHLESHGLGLSPLEQKKALRLGMNQIGNSSSLQFVFQLIQPVVQFPELLLCQSAVLLAILDFLLDILDCLLDIFLGHGSLHRNFVSSTIEDFVRSFVGTAFLLSRGVN